MTWDGSSVFCETGAEPEAEVNSGDFLLFFLTGVELLVANPIRHWDEWNGLRMEPSPTPKKSRNTLPYGGNTDSGT